MRTEHTTLRKNLPRERSNNYHHNHAGGLLEGVFPSLLPHSTLLTGRDHVCHECHHWLQVRWELPNGHHDIRISSKSPLRVRLFRGGDDLPSPVLATLLSLDRSLRGRHEAKRLGSSWILGAGSSVGCFRLSPVAGLSLG